MVPNYTQGDSINLATEVTGFTVSDNGAIVVNSTNGTLTIENCKDEIMSFADSNGNLIAYAFVASGEGVLDGRGISAFEVIIGADNAPNYILASGSGSSLYGGKGGGNTLAGGAGQDTFVYTDGTDLVTNATTGDKVNFNSEYSDFEFVNDDVAVKSTTGEVIIQNVMNQIIDVGAGDFVAHVYRAASEGVIDGRGFGGVEVISGMREVSNIIYAGGGGSSIYGGNGGMDTLIGGDGADCFIFGLNAGIDTVQNAQSNDYINLKGVTLDQITGVSSTAGLTKVSLVSGAELTVDGNNGAGYLIQGQMYDVNTETNSFVARS